MKKFTKFEEKIFFRFWVMLKKTARGGFHSLPVEIGLSCHNLKNTEQVLQPVGLNEVRALNPVNSFSQYTRAVKSRYHVCLWELNSQTNKLVGKSRL